MSRRHPPFGCATISPFDFRSQGTLQKLLIGPLFLTRRFKKRRQGLLQLSLNRAVSIEVAWQHLHSTELIILRKLARQDLDHRACHGRL